MIMNAMLEISKILFPIITYPYVARILHKSGTGKVDFALSVVTYFGMFAQLGIPNYGIKAVAKIRDDRQKLSKLVHELLFINLFMAVISYIAFGASLMIVPKFSRESVLLLVMSAIIFLNAIGIEWLYKGMEMYSYITKRSILFKFIGLIAMFLMVKSEDDYVIYGGITIFATAASDVLNFVNSRKYVDYKRQKDYNIRQHLKPVLVFFSMSVAATVYTNLDKVMLGFMKDDAAVGLYGASVKIKNILLGLVTSAGTVLLPRASRYVDQGKMDEFYAVLRKTMHLILLAAIPFCLYFMMYANEGISFLAGEEYAGSIFPMMIIMPTLVVIGITNISGIQMMVPLGMEKHVLISEIIGAVIDWNGEKKPEEKEAYAEQYRMYMNATYDTINEIDVILMHNVVPTFISCKSGRVDSKALHELQTVTSRFGGKYAKKAIVMATPCDEKTSGTNFFKQRAKDMHIWVIDNVYEMSDEQLLKKLIRIQGQ
jgi:O-antigen/teichoic acid export membrane protein